MNWNAISEGGLTFTKETIMQFQLARAVPGALLWVLDGSRNGELFEVDANGNVYPAFYPRSYVGLTNISFKAGL